MTPVKKELTKEEEEALNFNPDELRKISRKSALEILKRKEKILRILDSISIPDGKNEN